MISTWLLAVAGIFLLGFVFYRWARKNDDFFKSRNIQYLRPTFLLGNTGAFYLQQYRGNEYIQRLYNSFPNHKIFGMFDLRSPLYFVRDPEVIKQLAVKDFDHFENHQGFTKDSENIITRSLIMLRGEKWRKMRATLSPSFTGSKMRQMFELVSECAGDMSKTLWNKVDNGGEQLNVDIKDLLSKYTMDVIATTAFGIKVNSFENDQNEFLVNGKKLMAMNSFSTVVKFLLAAMFPRLFKWLGIDLVSSDVNTFFKSMVLGTMDARERNNIFRPDMIQLLMPMRKGNTISNSETDTISAKNDELVAAKENHPIVDNSTALKREWSDDDIVAQCFVFFAAGFDTTASVLSFLAYELAINPDVQEKLFAECTETEIALAGKPLPYDTLQKMKYMDNVVSESLRMWPATFFTDRISNRDYEYNDGQSQVLMKEGTAVWIPIYGLHHDEKYFPDPEKFQPERFSEENKGNIVPGTYMPFGVGPRNCIASRFALMEVKALIYHLVLNFQLEPNEKTQIPLQLAKSPSNTQTEKGIHLHLRLRKSHV